MSYVARYKRMVLKKIKTVGQMFRLTYTNFLANPSSEMKTQWQYSKLSNDAWLEKSKGFRRSQVEAKLFKYDNKVGKLLAKFTKGPQPTLHIKTLRDEHNALHHTPAKKNNILGKFYKTLYTKGDSRGESPGEWLERSTLPTLTEEETGVLGDPL